MDVIWLKVIAFFSFIIVGGVFAILPWGFQRVESRSRKAIITLAECFAGGIFLGTGWIHLLPESAAELATINSGSVPLANMLSVCGFLIVFLLEKVFFLTDEQPGHSHHSKPADNSITPSISTSEIEVVQVSLDSPNPRNSASIQDITTTPELTRTPAREHGGHDHGTAALLNSPSSSGASKIVPYMLMIVLSIHSIIAGVTLGVAPTTAAMAPLFVAIISHKWTESFALGVSLLHLSDLKKFIKFVAIYTSMVPSGLLLGAILSVTLEGGSAALTTAILNGIASGTFIYIALVDILLEQFTEAHLKFWKFMFCAFGFMLITLMFVLFDEGEGETTAE